MYCKLFRYLFSYVTCKYAAKCRWLAAGASSRNTTLFYLAVFLFGCSGGDDGGDSGGFDLYRHRLQYNPRDVQCDAPFPLKIAPLHGGSGPYIIHGSLGPSKSSTQTSISIGPAVFAGLTSVTDRQTDRQPDRLTDHATRSVTIDRIYVRSTGDEV